MGKVKAITSKQIQLIHIAKHQLDIDDNDYRSILSEFFKVSSSKDLSERQADKLLAHFKTVGFRVTPIKKTTPKKGRNIISLPTTFQLELIDILKKNVVWKAEDEGFQLWLEKRMRMKKISTKQDAARVIEGLKGMLKIDAEIIRLKALPFPIYLDETYFIDNFTGEVLPFRWVYDVHERRLIKVENEAYHG